MQIFYIDKFFISIRGIYLVLAFILIHIIGAIITMIIDFNDGTFEYASKYGDGIRFARSSDIVYADLILWELQFILFILDFIENLINNIISKKFLDKEKDNKT